MDERTQRGVRVGLVYLAMSFLSVGLWATFAPRQFFERFPGGGHHWVTGDGPYNAHLASDAGIGFLAVGTVLIVAAVGLQRGVVQAALVAAVVHDVGHLLFHLNHPSQALSSLDQVLSDGGLGLGAVVGAVLLVVVARQPSDQGDAGAPASVSPGAP